MPASQARKEIEASATLEALEALRVSYLGKSGIITEQLKSLGILPPEERKAKGAEINQLKQEVSALLDERKKLLEAKSLEAKLSSEKVDITLPVRAPTIGALHAIPTVIEEISAIFRELGFNVAEGPNIEDDYHNFTALNIPEDHPARQMHDTFYIEGAKTQLLRTHTSPVQVRYMKEHKPPVRIIVPGRVYRHDSDMTHSPMFHQVEGLCIDKHIHMGHLKGCLEHFIHRFFGRSDIELRFRPSFFPFTEPSAEVDIRWKGDRWLEVLGAGMVHPKVLEAMGVEPGYQGFAFGLGVERFAMLKYGIEDLRTFFNSDMRWLKHFGFSPFKEKAI